MAYRAPRPHAVRHSRLQTRLARIAGGVVFAAVMLLLIGFAERAIPPQHAPWKPLRLVDPVGAATRIKAARIGQDPAACRAILRRAGDRSPASGSLSLGRCALANWRAKLVPWISACFTPAKDCGAERKPPLSYYLLAIFRIVSISHP